MIDLDILAYSSTTDAYKNTGVFTATLGLSGTIPAGTERTFTTTITLAENQVFGYALAQYKEFVKLGTAQYQLIPTFDADTPTTPTGNLASYIVYIINGTQVTFKAGIFNPYGGTETITAISFPIIYVTYTLAR